MENNGSHGSHEQPSPNPESFAARLKRLRKRSNLSVAQTARALGVAESTYREWEYGRQIKGEPYHELSKIFNVSLSELLAGAHNEQQKILDELHIIEASIRRIRELI